MKEDMREKIGKNVEKKGQIVEKDRMSLEFQKKKKIQDEEMEDVENIEKEIIMKNEKVKNRMMDVEDEIEEGEMEILGEKYGEEVSVV